MSQNILGYRFGDCELDLELMALRRHGVEVPVQRRQFDLLLYLIENRDRLVSRAELLRNVWPEVSVSECALSTTLRGVRRLIGDDGRRQRMIATRRGFGLRFAAPVTARLQGLEVAARDAARLHRVHTDLHGSPHHRFEGGRVGTAGGV